MVVIGGSVTHNDAEIADFWDNGIGVYDLTELSWRRFYDSEAAPYVTPDMVQKYNDDNPYPRQFSDPVVEGLVHTDKCVYRCC